MTTTNSYLKWTLRITNEHDGVSIAAIGSDRTIGQAVKEAGARDGVRKIEIFDGPVHVKTVHPRRSR